MSGAPSLHRSPLSTLGAAALLVALVGALGGCKKKGLDDPANDPNVVARAREALTCPWKDVEETKDASAPDDEKADKGCLAEERWKNAPEVRAAAAEPTLLAMLADERPPVRWLAGHALRERPDPITNAAHAKTLVEATRRETHARVGDELGAAVGRLDLKATSLEADVRELATKHALPSVRARIVGRTMKANPQMIDVVLEAAKGASDVEVRRAAIRGLSHVQDDRVEDAAKVWRDAVTGGDVELSEWAIWHCGLHPRVCASQWDAVLDVLEKRMKTPKITNLQTVETIHGSDKASDAQKARAEKVLVAIVDDERASGVWRMMALEGLKRGAPEVAKALAAKHKSSPDPVFSSAAGDHLAEAADAGAPDAGAADAAIADAGLSGK